jgi:hypothetical protein
MLNFNKGGRLTPPRLIDSTTDELYDTFVKGASPKRADLFESYFRYSTDLKALSGEQTLYQWIDGSFVTLSQPNPGDLDLVTFLPEELIKKLGSSLKPFLFPDSLTNYPGLDGYIVRVLSPESRNYNLFESDRIYWMHQFGRTRRDRNGKRYFKGFLGIYF